MAFVWSKNQENICEGRFPRTLFVQLECSEDRDWAIQLLKDSGGRKSEETIWAKPDRKFED